MKVAIRFIKKIGFIALLSLAWFISVCATIDLPVFYRAPFFQGEGRHKIADWSTKIMARYGQGHTWDSFDYQSKKKPLLSIAGPMDIARLGLGTNIDATKQPLTNNYWGTVATLQPTAGNDGKIDLSGRFNENDLSFELTQFITYGFFAQVYVPYREVTIDRIGYKNKGAAAIKGIPVATIFNNFDAILAEQGMKPLATPFKKSGVADVAASIGWQGYSKVGSEWIMDLAGSLQAGVLIPVTGQLDDKYVAAVPLGNDKMLGFLAHATGEIGVFDWVAVGGYAGGMVFVDDTRTIRMRTHEGQSGWLRFGKGFAKVSQGTLWDCGGYARLGAIFSGLSVFCGYSFTRQEATRLRVDDANFKVMVTKYDTTAAKVQLTESYDQGDKETVVNADQRLGAWEAHVVHLGLTLDVGGKKAKFSPRLQFEYAYPFDGKMLFKAPVVGGTAGLQFSLGF